MKPIARESAVNQVRRRFSRAGVAGCAFVAVALASAFFAVAQEPNAPAQTNDATGTRWRTSAGSTQEPNAPAQTNDATAAEILSRLSDMVQGDDSTQDEDVAPSSHPPEANGRAQATATAPGGDRASKANRFDNPGRAQNNDRRSRGRRNNRSNSNPSGGYGSAGNYGQGGMNSLSQTNDGSSTLDYAAFRIIVDRNIFDPNRFPRRGPNPRTPPRSFDAITLVGTMSYEKGTFAFFDGTSSDYRKALRLTDTIAGYKVASITPNSVKLAAGTNEFELNVGSALRREENGPWQPSSQFASYASISTSSSTNSATSTSPGSDSAAAGMESDVIKRLMQKREKE